LWFGRVQSVFGDLERLKIDGTSKLTELKQLVAKSKMMPPLE